MKIEDLQFKDKVIICGEELKIGATVFEFNVINGSVNYYMDFLDHYNTAPIEIIYPIFLNDQIFLDNGFEEVESVNGIGFYYKDIIVDKDTLNVKIGDKFNNCIYTVHDFQHVLRQFGYEDFANTLKIIPEHVEFNNKENADA